MSANPRPDGGLWPHALALYARPGVAPLCLEAQDTLGADVPLLLWAAWAASRGYRLTNGDMTRAEALATAWRAPVIQPLRRARRALKDMTSLGDAGAGTLYQAVKQAELEAERQYMAALEHLAEDWPHPGRANNDALRDNLARLLPPTARAVTERLHKALS
ncbi:MAG: TIGR02444 family protein [Azospirillaceae bacterium]|nr:TIGR02444 family protein [Azospirillaceae bacterium]